MNDNRIDDTDRLLREREARSLTLMLAVALTAYVAIGIQLTVQFVRQSYEASGLALGFGYVGTSIVVGVTVLFALHKRRWIGGIGFLVAFFSATSAAVIGIVMWQGFVVTAPVAILTKLPLAAAGMSAIALMALTLRPLYVVIVGTGVAMTLLGFFGLAALDPDAVFGSGTGAGADAAYLGGAISAYRLAFELVMVVAATASTAFAAHFARQTIREAVALQRTTDQLSRYFSPDIASGIRDGGDAFLRPGGREQEVVVLFSDLVGYTHLCAGLSASQALALLSEYQEWMVAEIFKAGGTIDKFIGDGIMATFGTPNPVPDAADRAVRAARGMMAGLTALNEDRAKRGQPPLAQRIGIHAGLAAVGNVGTAQRMEFTVIGDTVNVASRIEAACKKTGRIAMISGAVLSRLSELVATEPLGPVSLDGQPAPIELYALAVSA